MRRWLQKWRRSSGCSEPVRFACACCDFLTLSEAPPGTYEICPVCWWEDDPVQFDDHHDDGGANHVSLREARANFRAIGASSAEFLEFVRPPHPDERP